MDAEHERCAAALETLRQDLKPASLAAVLKEVETHFAHEEELLSRHAALRSDVDRLRWDLEELRRARRVVLFAPVPSASAIIRLRDGVLLLSRPEVLVP